MCLHLYTTYPLLEPWWSYTSSHWKPILPHTLWISFPPAFWQGWWYWLLPLIYSASRFHLDFNDSVRERSSLPSTFNAALWHRLHRSAPQYLLSLPFSKRGQTVLSFGIGRTVGDFSLSFQSISITCAINQNENRTNRAEKKSDNPYLYRGEFYIFQCILINHPSRKHM